MTEQKIYANGGDGTFDENDEPGTRSSADTGGLKPCPFCGGKPSLVTIEPHSHKGGIAAFMPDHPGSAYIECSCGAGLIDVDEKTVADRWNWRTTNEPQEVPTPIELAIEREEKYLHDLIDDEAVGSVMHGDIEGAFHRLNEALAHSRPQSETGK